MNATPIYDAAAWDAGFAPLPEPVVCYRCAAEPAHTEHLCRACRGEVAANVADARDELVRVVFTRDTRALGDYPADFRVIPL